MLDLRPTVNLIPIKNEDPATIENLVAGLNGAVYVVDDSAVRLNPTPRVRTLDGAGSLGASLVEGMRRLRDKGMGEIMVIDAGGSHDPHHSARVKAVDADVVIGSRFCPGGSHDGPWWRSVGSRAYAAALNWLFDTDIKDWTSGYRLYSQRAVNEILLAEPSCKGHAIQAEMLAVCVEQGCTVVEVPITYTVGSGSSFNWKTAREALGLLWRLAWN